MMVMQELTLEQAAHLVASRVVSVKQAFEMPAAVTDALKGIGNTVKDYAGKFDASNPLHAALLTGGLGAGGGAVSSLLSSDKEKRKRWLQNALFGGAVGGIGGGAASALYGQLGPGGAMTKYDQTQIDAAKKPQAPTAQEGLTHAWEASGVPVALEKIKSQLGGGSGDRSRLLQALPPEAAVPSGAAIGYGADKLLNQHAINKGQKTDLQAALADPKFRGTVSSMNKLREDSGRAPVTGSHLGNLEAELNKSFMERLGFGGKPKVAPTPAPAPTPHPSQAFSSAIPPQRPPAAPKAMPPEPPLTGEPLRHLTNTAVQSRGAQSAVPKRRSGVRGAVLGAGAGFLLNAMGAPHLSPNQKRQQSGQPLIQN